MPLAEVGPTMGGPGDSCCPLSEPGYPVDGNACPHGDKPHRLFRPVWRMAAWTAGSWDWFSGESNPDSPRLAPKSGLP